MSLPEQPSRALAPPEDVTLAGGGIERRRMLAVLVGAALMTPVLAACSDGSGFRPVYGSSAVGGGTADQKLAQVDVPAVPSRVGQRVRNELSFQSTGGGLPAQPIYRLELAMRESLASTLIARTGDAASQVYSLDASFRLVRLSDKKVVLDGTASSRAGFERYTTIFSNVRAREDAENRAARIVAQDIKVRLSAYLATQA